MAKGERMDADIRRYGGEGEDVTKHGWDNRRGSMAEKKVVDENNQNKKVV